MPVIPGGRELRQMIEIAMQDRAPEMHARLSKNGLLKQEIENRVLIAREAHEMASSRSRSTIQANPDPVFLVQAAKMNRAYQESWSQALELAIDFPREESDLEETE